MYHFVYQSHFLPDFDLSGKKQLIPNSLYYIELNGLTLGRIELSTYCLEVFIFVVQIIPYAFK